MPDQLVGTDPLLIANSHDVPIEDVRVGDVGIFAGALILVTGPFGPSKLDWPDGLPVLVLGTGKADHLCAKTLRWVGHVPARDASQ